MDFEYPYLRINNIRLTARARGKTIAERLHRINRRAKGDYKPIQSFVLFQDGTRKNLEEFETWDEAEKWARKNRDYVTVGTDKPKKVL